MSAYLIALVEVTDDAWIPAYAAEVHDIAARHGGRYLSRSGNVTRLEGDPAVPTAVAIIEFPDVAAAQAFAADPAYAPHAAARQKGTVSRFFIIDDTDALGSIPYLAKA